MNKIAKKNVNPEQYKFFAFISYSSKDIEWGKRVQRKLEHYRMPSTLCSARGWERQPIKPVFFAPTDIQPGPLSEELQERLRASRNLIVICSPNSAQSEWVSREIEFFHSIGRTKNIHFFIIDGIPNSGKAEIECFNPVIKKLGLPEILGANINEKVSLWPWINKERAYVQLISKLLDVEFDTIWQRHKRLMRQKVMAWGFGFMLVLASLFFVWSMTQAIDVEVELNETSVHNDMLPQLENAIVSLTLEDGTNEVDTIKRYDEKGILNHIPQKFMNKPVHVTMSCRHFIKIDTILTLEKKMMLDIQRDPSVYGNIRFDIWNEDGQGVKDVRIIIEGHETLSDKNGHVELFIPLEQQQEKYHVISSIPLLKDTIHMPCGNDHIIKIR